MDNRIYIYTDGACKGNPGPGGWGALLIYKEHKKEINGFSKDTTNNIMELTAVIESLLIIKQKSDITIITDSNYVKDGITKWIANWKKKGWKTSNKKPVKNKDLWKKLDDLSNNHNIKWEWVRGHTGNPGNEKADQLANEAIIKNLT
ncbi:MAG: ribonuclease HI [Candidatus Marinimicrobia bacterium]|nr:ribonuclease HI [Candidatus Neomarinimicrobiota bacterium]|tara:strand:+ start:17808 stop:18248 length:441 start_codon:yes stop_codon:yes gene_type:complete